MRAASKGTVRQKKVPPGPKGKGAANLLAIQRDPTTFLTKLAREYGDIVRFRLGPAEVFFLNHPLYVKEVLQGRDWNFVKALGAKKMKQLLGDGLLTSEGYFHRRQRLLAQPAFHTQRITKYAEIMVEYGRRARERWREGETLDIAEEMGRVTMAIVAKTLFDTDVESEAKEIGAALTAVLQMFSALGGPFSEILQRLSLPRSKRFERAQAQLVGTVERIIQERRASQEDRGDLLSTLLSAQDAEGGGMSDELVRDEVMTLFLAGHETTANALAWTWYLLSQHQEAEAKFHAEIDSVLAGRLPSAGDIPRLPYTEMVFSEVIRLYPPAWVLRRQALSDFKIGGYVLPAGSYVVVSQYVLHRDARFYPEPLKFDPERWTPDKMAARPKFAYFPFGSGTRLCIGQPFAWTEGLLLMATFAQQWKLRLAPAHQVGLHPSLTLRPKNGMPMTLERR